MKKNVLLIILCSIAIEFNRGQDVSIPSSLGPNTFTSGTGDGASLSTYNAILKLHNGIAIGSPYVSNGSGGFIDKATIVFDGRTGNINTLGQLFSNSIISNSEFYFPSFNDYRTNCFMKGTGDGASLTTYNTILNLHSGLAIGSPFVNDGNGGFVNKATIVFDGRTGDIVTLGLITSKKIHTTEVKVDLNGWSDFVFKSTYKLKSLYEVENFINQNGHLSEIPSESEVKNEGVNLGEIQTKLLQKIEELTLYTIDQQKQIDALKKEIQEMKK